MNGYQESKGFPTRQTKSGVQLQLPHLLAERTRVPLVHGTHEDPNSHQCAVHLLQDQLPKWFPRI